MNRSTPGLLVHHQLPEFTQTHVHRVGDAIQPSHPLSSPFPPAPNPSQRQSLFQWVNSLHEVAKVLEFQLYHHLVNSLQFKIHLFVDIILIFLTRWNSSHTLFFEPFISSNRSMVLICSWDIWLHLSLDCQIHEGKDFISGLVQFHLWTQDSCCHMIALNT